MAIETINLPTLKRLKNNVIGNPLAKLTLAQDEQFVQGLVECLNRPPLSTTEAQGSQDDIRIEAAHVISSISYGSQEALRSLLRANAPQDFLFAISNFQSTDSTALKAAFARALRALAASISETVGPSQWGLRSDGSDVRYEAKAALDSFFQLESLDIYLPLLIDTSIQTSTSIAQLLASVIRNPVHRTIVTDWLPPSDRLKEVKGKRGWEKPDTTNSNAPGRQGGWVARNLIILLKKKDTKLQEAALAALAALAKDNLGVSNILTRSSSDRDMSSPLSAILSLSKIRSIDVQLSACLCATHILRATSSNHAAPIDSSSAPSIIHSMNRIIDSASESRQHRTRACFILNYLVTDDTQLCQLAVDRGSLEKLANLAKSITPLDAESEWDEDEPESISCLREAALRTIAALCLFEHEPRREVTDNLRLIPVILASLSHRHVGVRFAACQCVRVLSRAVAVIRTNIVDSGLGLTVFEIFKKEDEDRHITNAALSAVCNIVNEFSPLRPVFIEKGVVARLVQLINTEDSDLRLNSLWAVKNLLRKTNIDTKQEVMSQLGWAHLAKLLDDPEPKVQEQAFWVIRNLAENEFGIDLIFQQLGTNELFNSLTSGLESSHEEVVLQAAFAMANLANGDPSQQTLIIRTPRILSSLRSCMSDAKVEVRRPAVSCILQLISSEYRDELQDAGIITTLRHMCDRSGGVSLSPGGRMSGHHHIIEDDKEVIDLARQAINIWDGY